MSKRKEKNSEEKTVGHSWALNLEAQKRDWMIPDVFGLFPELPGLMSKDGGGKSRVQEIADCLTEPIRKVEHSAQARRRTKLKLFYAAGSVLNFLSPALRDQILAEIGGLLPRKGNSTFLNVLNAIEALPDDKSEKQAVQRARSETALALSHAFHVGWSPTELIERLSQPGESVHKWALFQSKRSKERVEDFRLPPETKYLSERNDDFYGNQHTSSDEMKKQRTEAEQQDAVAARQAAEAKEREINRREAETSYVETHAAELKATLTPELAALSREMILWVRLGKQGRIQKIRGVRCIGSRKPAPEEMEDIFQQISHLRLEA